MPLGTVLMVLHTCSLQVHIMQQQTRREQQTLWQASHALTASIGRKCMSLHCLWQLDACTIKCMAASCFPGITPWQLHGSTLHGRFSQLLPLLLAFTSLSCDGRQRHVAETLLQMVAAQKTCKEWTDSASPYSCSMLQC